MPDPVDNPKQTAVIVTTIFSPTPAMFAICQGARSAGHQVIVAGDAKGPERFELTGAVLLTLEDQKEFSELGRCAPTGSYARKNLAYLWAMQSGVEVILETDDDNTPESSFFSPTPQNLFVPAAPDRKWLNVYEYFLEAGRVWPRGLPLEHVEPGHAFVPFDSLELVDVDAPIQQGLADGDPDVDAVYRMTGTLPVSFLPKRSVALLEGTWCPFNSQNTIWYRDAFQLLYLPSFCTFRMTDIWRSFVAQRIAWANGWSLVFHSPTVWQDRNEHDLLSDFREEMPGYLHNSEIATALSEVDVPSGVENIGTAMRACYQRLIEMRLIGSDEIGLLNLWLVESRSYLP